SDEQLALQTQTDCTVGCQAVPVGMFDETLKLRRGPHPVSGPHEHRRRIDQRDAKRYGVIKSVSLADRRFACRQSLFGLPSKPQTACVSRQSPDPFRAHPLTAVEIIERTGVKEGLLFPVDDKCGRAATLMRCVAIEAKIDPIVAAYRWGMRQRVGY